MEESLSDPDEIKRKIKEYLKEQKNLDARILVLEKMAAARSNPEKSKEIFRDKLKKAKRKLKGLILNISKLQNELEEIKE